ncbi:MAG: recombinase family protein [Lachnospiraceae bacterium]|nr:recombinase family protein [Lachnospiraceae bacterium]
MLAAIYCRLSVEDEKSPNSPSVSESILNQQLLLTEYARDHGMEIYAVYVDENYSGLNNRRPAFCRLLDDARH